MALVGGVEGMVLVVSIQIEHNNTMLRLSAQLSLNIGPCQFYCLQCSGSPTTIQLVALLSCSLLISFFFLRIGTFYYIRISELQ